MYDEERNNQLGFKVKGVALVLLLGFIFITLLLGIRTVDAGEVGVVTRFGKVTGRTLEPGAHLVAPWIDGVLRYDTKKVIYETTTEEKQKGSQADFKDFPVDTNTKDGQRVDVYYTVRFSVDPTQAGWIAQNVGTQNALVEKIVKTESRIWARNVPRRFDAENLYTGAGSQEVQNEIFNALLPTFKSNGIVLDGVGIREIKFSDEYIGAIEQKQIQFVKVETEKNIADQAEFQKKARITTAEGQAQEQRLQRETISVELLQKMLIEKWDGHYPQYLITGGGADQFILPLPNK